HFKTAHELRSLRTDNAKEGAARIWTRPTFEVHGITGGYSGPGGEKNIPHKAEGKNSIRLGPHPDPQKIIELLKKYVKEKCPDAEVEKQGTLKPYLGDFKGKFPTAAKEAMKLAFNKDAAFIREGGSIGAVVSMKELLGIPIVFLGLSLPE